MIRRGPDAGDYYLDEGNKVVLGHRRLSILDLSEHGAQPMVSKSERYVLVYNGEIYNYQDIYHKMIADGYSISLRGSSDTEILLEAIECYGLHDTLKLAKGMFAIGLLDRKEKKMQLARDRMGEKPLYYGYINGSFAFASDMNSLKAIEGFHNPVSQEVLPLYFSYGYIPAPYTIYQDIYKLQQGTILTIEAPYTQYEMTEYWNIKEVAKNGEANPFTGSEEEATKELERLLTQSIQGQMIADVPLGAFLSGGIDSTLVVALMQSISSQKVQTFTIGLKENGYDEAGIAAQTSKHLGTNHTELYLGYEDVMNVVPELSRAYGEPFADSSQIPTMLVSKLAREHVTVSLSGDGGDELFCGYNSYLGAQHGLGVLKSKGAQIPSGIRSSIGHISKCMANRHTPILHKVGSVFTVNSLEDYKKATHQSEYESKYLAKIRKRPCTQYESYPSGYLGEPIHNLMLMDQIQYLPDDILTKVDRAAMYYSLETRVPLLDKDVITFAWSLPLSYTFEQGMTKKILKNLLYQYVPRELMERPKTGFAIPIDQWLQKGSMREWAESLMSDGFSKNKEFIDQKVAMNLWNQFQKSGQFTPTIWYLLMMQQWALTQ